MAAINQINHPSAFFRPLKHPPFHAGSYDFASRRHSARRDSSYSAQRVRFEYAPKDERLRKLRFELLTSALLTSDQVTKHKGPLQNLACLVSRLSGQNILTSLDSLSQFSLLPQLRSIFRLPKLSWAIRPHLPRSAQVGR